MSYPFHKRARLSSVQDLCVHHVQQLTIGQIWMDRNILTLQCLLCQTLCRVCVVSDLSVNIFSGRPKHPLLGYNILWLRFSHLD